MYVIHELEDAIKDCNNGDLTANDGGPHAWDEGWAFYAGSLEGSTGEGEAASRQLRRNDILINRTVRRNACKLCNCFNGK